MGLQQDIKKDLTAAIKAKDGPLKDAIRVILGEFARSPKKELTNDEVIRIIKKLGKSEKEVLDQTGRENSRFMEVIQGYLPQMASDADIIAWVKANIDFSQYHNKMQAMGGIMQHFNTAADGNQVKALLMKMET